MPHMHVGDRLIMSVLWPGPSAWNTLRERCGLADKNMACLSVQFRNEYIDEQRDK